MSARAKNFISNFCVNQCLCLTLLFTLLSAAGCATVGPTAIRSGRLAYNEAIIETHNQQMLMVIIRTRYAERSNMLAVASVTANVRVTTNAGIQLGFGDEDDYIGNLVPFSAGASYEENPTISYVPVGGEKYVHALMSPIPIATLALFSANVIDQAGIYTALVASVNGIHNPDFFFSDVEPDPRFDRFIAIMTKLDRVNRMRWIREGEDGAFSIVIDQEDSAYAADVSELLDILGLRKLETHSSLLTIPVFPGLDGRRQGGIGITTRSVFGLVEILAGAIEIPEPDQISGAAMNYPSPGLTGSTLHIGFTTDRPASASVAVEYRGGWFHIGETDQVTKIYFKLLGALWSVTMAHTTPTSSATPVLTVPVSR